MLMCFGVRNTGAAFMSEIVRYDVSEYLAYSSIYADDIPELLSRLAMTPAMRRLSDIGMHCGCEYAGFPIYKQVRFNYTRLMHSIGVASIVWNFTGDVRQAVAGLLHDIATPVFAHTIDFLNNDYMMQESTEDKTLAVIENSEEITSLLNEYEILVEDVCDYHKYPIADNDTPMLSADRLEYTLGNGYIVYNMGSNQINGIYDDLCVAENEYGDPELCFRSVDIAKEFIEISLRNSHLFVSDEDRFSMQYLSDILRRAIELGVLTFNDLHTTESDVIRKLNEYEELSAAWDKYTKLSSVSSSREKLKDCYCVNISAKKRYIDPLVLVRDAVKRISKIDSDTKIAIESFLRLDFDKWLYII